MQNHTLKDMKKVSLTEDISHFDQSMYTKNQNESAHTRPITKILNPQILDFYN